MNVSRAIRSETGKFQPVTAETKQQYLQRSDQELEVKESVYEIL